MAIPCRSHAQKQELDVVPPAVELSGPESSQQILVRQRSGERTFDVTRRVHYEVIDSSVASISASGMLVPLAEGQTEIVIRMPEEDSHNQSSVTWRLPVQVRGIHQPEPVSFRNEVTAILTKAGCNSGGCHGKAEGQNGFCLSIFGFDAESDYAALVKEARGRRISMTHPEDSLLLRKATAAMPHGGGRRIEPQGNRYRRLLRWIQEGAALDAADSEQGLIVALEVTPAEQILLADQSQQLQVTAIDSRGRRFCATADAEYLSNAPSIADVDSTGLVRASNVPGEAAILVRYLGHVATCRITMPRENVIVQRPPENNFIDRLVWDQLERLGIEPSGLCDDATFLRRASLDVIGTLPTPDEVRAFLDDPRADKRARLIDELLERDEYAVYWAMKWLDVLRADQLVITPQATAAMQRWLRRCFRENRPFDQMARDLLMAQGPTQAEGPAAFYKVLQKPDEASRSISQLLLGVRIECAQCHHHPSERWSQSDYVGLAGFFTGVSLKKLPDGSEAVVSLGGKDLPHPRTGETIPARALGSRPADFTDVIDRRAVLADWMTARDNPMFATAIANRMWAHYFGRGLIEPIDDIRATNPASNEPLMAALAQHMHETQFDLKQFTRTLLNSRTYQLASEATPSNQDDEQSFSHAAYKSLPAEVLLDAICQSTGVAEKFNGWPLGYRSIQIWDNRVPSYFFTIFGRPVRGTVCECERSNAPSISQALHLLNSPEIMQKIQERSGVARSLANSRLAPREIIEQLYLGTVSRFPREEETQLMLQAFSQQSSRRTAAEDVLWALLNSKEFLLNH